MPLYLGYYVTHSFEDTETNTISFAPHRDSSKPPLEPAVSNSSQDGVGNITGELSVVYVRQDVENGEILATQYALMSSILLFFIWIMIVLFFVYQGDSANAGKAVGSTVAGAITSIAVYYIVEWIALLYLQPGDYVEPVKPSLEAVTDFSSFLNLISL